MTVNGCEVLKVSASSSKQMGGGGTHPHVLLQQNSENTMNLIVFFLYNLQISDSKAQSLTVRVLMVNLCWCICSVLAPNSLGAKCLQFETCSSKLNTTFW